MTNSIIFPETKTDASRRAQPQVAAAYFCWRSIIALILITAAGLKLHNLWVTPIRAEFWMQQHLFFLLVAYIEIAAATFLISNIRPRMTAYACALLFLIFSIATGRQIALDQSSCGCLGIIEFPATWMFLFDSVACALTGDQLLIR